MCLPDILSVVPKGREKALRLQVSTFSVPSETCPSLFRFENRKPLLNCQDGDKIRSLANLLREHRNEFCLTSITIDNIEKLTRIVVVAYNRERSGLATGSS
jgi:hypothetical protein